MWDMQEWKDCVESCFFINDLNRWLKEFLSRQASASNEGEEWDLMHQNAYKWREICSADIQKMMLPSFWGQWHISAHWGEFSLSKVTSHSLKEALYWIFLTGWVLIDGDSKRYIKEKRVPPMPWPGWSGCLSKISDIRKNPVFG